MVFADDFARRFQAQTVSYTHLDVYKRPHGGFQIGADKVDGEGDAFFQQAAYAQPPAGTVPAEFPIREVQFIHFQARCV